MAHRKKQKNRKKTVITNEFGRVVSNPDKFSGEHFVVGKNIKVSDVIKLIRQNKKNKEIIRKYPELTNMDIESCRAWQVRFAPETLSDKFNNVSKDDKIFLLDENMSYIMLHKVAKNFGWSTHVYAEGLKKADDEKDIWKLAIDQKYKAVLTSDYDFIDISKTHRKKLITRYGGVDNAPTHTPTVLIVPSIPPYKIVSLLKKNKPEVAQFIEDNKHAYAKLSGNGLLKVGTEKALRSWQKNTNANNNKRPKGP
jgi:uncharacterized protein (DUF433 family)/predicted nuclease of predicted toxin-antitoxin system